MHFGFKLDNLLFLNNMSKNLEEKNTHTICTQTTKEILHAKRHCVEHVGSRCQLNLSYTKNYLIKLRSARGLRYETNPLVKCQIKMKTSKRQNENINQRDKERRGQGDMREFLPSTTPLQAFEQLICTEIRPHCNYNFVTPLLHRGHNKGQQILIVGTLPHPSIERPRLRGEGATPTQVVQLGEASSYGGVAVRRVIVRREGLGSRPGPGHILEAGRLECGSDVVGGFKDDRLVFVAITPAN